MTTEHRQIAIVTSYDELIEAIRRRAVERGVSHNQLDELAGLPTGYCGKVLGPSQVKKLGPLSMSVMLQALGLALVVVEDPVSLARVADRHGGRDADQARAANHSSPAGKAMMSRVFKHFAKLGGRARMRKMTKAQRSDHGRRAINARWSKARRRRRWRGNQAKSL